MATTTTNLEGELVFSVDFDTETPIIAGPRCIIAIKHGGKVFGPKLNGIMCRPSSDWVSIRKDLGGVVILLVHVLIETDDGAHVYYKFDGRSARDPANPANSTIHGSATFETHDEKYMWLNHKILFGKGTKTGGNIKIDYYDLDLNNN